MNFECMFSGIIGAIIGIIASFAISFLNEYFETKSCVNAIKSEILCLKNLLFKTFDNVITIDETPLELYYPLNTDYFTIFNNNSSRIGKINNKEERELIVSTYVTAKYFLDCLRSNNECLLEMEQAKTKDEIKWAEESLRHSKINNIIPAYVNLKNLLNKFSDI